MLMMQSRGTVTKTFRKLGPTQSPVVSAAIDKRSSDSKASSAVRKTLRNGSVVFVILMDMLVINVRIANNDSSLFSPL